MASAVSDLRSGGGNERFNKEALSWDSRPMVREASKSASTVILERLKSKSINPQTLDVLEIGCGTGILSFFVAPQVKQVVAIDAAQGMIDVLKRKLKENPDAPGNVVPIAVLLEDPEDPVLPEGTNGKRLKFDLILSHLVLHHIPDLKAVLKTMFGCLKPGGQVMLTDFEDFGPEAKRFHPASKMGGVERHGIHAETMAGLLREVGFVDVSVQPKWTMNKKVEKHEGEFGESGAPKDGQGEPMDFPFVLCCGKKP